MENLLACPVCESNSLSHAFTVKDHFLTNEIFQISKCDSCGFLFTNPRPYPDEMPKYYDSDEYFSHDLSNRNFLSNVYSFIRKLSVIKKYSLITNFKRSGNILDIGCGTGEVLHFFSQKGWQTSGIEPAEKPRLFAQSNYGLRVYTEKNLDLFEEQSFDVITMWHVLEHVSRLNERIDQVKRLLKNDGILIIALPNSNSWDSGYYKEYWAAWDVPRHLYHFTQTSIRLLLSKHNLNIHEIVPMKFDSYYVSLLSEKYKSGKTKLFRSTLNGFRSNINAKKNSNNYSSLIYLAKK